MTPSEDSTSALGKEEGMASLLPLIAQDYAGDNGDYRYTLEQVESYEIDPVVEKRVLSQFDRRILPMIIVMYLFQSLDRGNISNAKSDGMDKDLGFKGNQWNTMLTVFYIPYCLFAYPGTFLSKKFGPNNTMPIYMFGWGAMALASAGVRNFGTTVAVRLILGMFEGCFGASMIMYMALFYKRDELGRRMAAWSCMVGVSGAFSGLLSYGLFQVNTSLHGWQLLFIIEGALTLLFAVVAWFVLPPVPRRATFLTGADRVVGVMRLLKDSTTDVDTPFSFAEYIKPAREWQTWAWGGYCLIYGVSNQTATVFLTQIIGRWGYSTIKTNILTVPPYATAVIFMLFMVWSSDKCRERTLHTMFSNLLVCVGAIAIACIPVSNVGAGYFCTFLITCGSFLPSVLFQSFVQNNTTAENSRAFRAAVMNFGSNAGGIVSANIFLEQFKPKYVTPLIVSACIAALGIVVLGLIRGHMMWDNAKRNREQGVTWTSKDVPTAALKDGPANPSYRHFL